MSYTLLWCKFDTFDAPPDYFIFDDHRTESRGRIDYLYQHWWCSSDALVPSVKAGAHWPRPSDAGETSASLLYVQHRKRTREIATGPRWMDDVPSSFFVCTRQVHEGLRTLIKVSKYCTFLTVLLRIWGKLKHPGHILPLHELNQSDHIGKERLKKERQTGKKGRNWSSNNDCYWRSHSSVICRSAC